MNTDKPMPLEFNGGEEQPLPIKKLPKAKRKKYSKEMIEAQAFAAFGAKILRIKTTAVAALGEVAQAAGIKKLGHGKILLASDNAEQAIAVLGELVTELREKSPHVDHSLILEIMRLQREFNRQILESAHAHFNADRAPVVGTNGAHISVPFPSGSPVMLAVGQAPAQVEGKTSDT